jgi:ATP-dependent helicase/nuclease subunit A
MRPQLVPPPETLDLQARAADPDHSVWVSANAGSGKTHVLSQRVVRLLLQGIDPSRILCLTYTRAAAANMSNRVFKDLADWSMLGDAELSRRIAAIERRDPNAKKLTRARRLFARALETPGGLKIQTIHAFCEAVLHQFPLEANIAAHFDMLDPRMEQALFAEVRRDMIGGAVAADNPELGEAFATVLSRGGEFGLDTLLGEIVNRRDGLRAFIDRLAGEPGFVELYDEFDVPRGETARAVAERAWPLADFSRDYFARFAAVAEEEGAARVINDMLPHLRHAFEETDPERRLDLLVAGFLKGDGTPYSLTTTFKAAMRRKLPDVNERYLAAANAVIAAAERVALIRMLEGTCAALTIADWLIARYEQVKTGRGFLDFNDLITRTVRLLARADVGPWVQYKLDQGIDHILIDEAQDTSPQQWDVVKRLAEEFFAGLGARENIARSVFAVGDEKQSIYSFQGAAPEAFAETRHYFGERAEQAGSRVEKVELTWSFRSTNDVLEAVDAVFAPEPARRGVTAGTGVRHRAIRAADPGYVEIWPSIAADAVEEPDDWTLPVDHARAAAVRVAENIARTINGWISAGEIIEGTGKRLSPGDVMVLVRKRDRFMHALGRALKAKSIAVAGADRLRLAGHIAVRDLMALGRVLLQPNDDLSLAALLKSPAFGLSEETLFALAAGRARGVSLFAALRQKSREDAALGDVVARLDRWADEAAFRPVFEFYAGVLGRDRMRARFIARLGPEAAEVVDEFLSFCLAEEKTGLPGLEAFLTTLENAGPELKRQMDQTRDEVRIMTVHAAKGLEAPVVFLVDGGSKPVSDQHLPRLMPFETRKIGAGRGYLWRSGVDVANPFSEQAMQRARDLADDEYRRLLYVGMTRAEDRLIVCGYHGRGKPGNSWHNLVSAGIGASEHTTEAVNRFTGQTVRRFRVTDISGSKRGAPPEQGRFSLEAGMPPELARPAPPPEELPRPLSPSGASLLIEQESPAGVVTRSPVLEAEEPGLAIRRGIAMHRLLQMLPALPLGERAAATARYLARVGADWPAEERDRIAETALAVLAAPDFAPLFSPESRAEVALMGTIAVRGKPRAVSGTVDRLSVSAKEVLILDYKTNRPPPLDLAGVPPGYVLQLALYRALLSPLYPGRPVRAALLFTEAPRLIELPPEAMDTALARLTGA